MFALTRQQRNWARDLLRYCSSLDGDWSLKTYPVRDALVEEQAAYESFALVFEERFQRIEQAILDHHLKPEWAMQQFLQSPAAGEEMLNEFLEYQNWRLALKTLHDACNDLQEHVREVHPGWRA